jgi:hypothetical protein
MVQQVAPEYQVKVLQGAVEPLLHQIMVVVVVVVLVRLVLMVRQL